MDLERIKLARNESAFWAMQYRTVCLAVVVFFGCAFYACDRQYAADAITRRGSPVVQTCVQHQAVDLVVVQKGQ